MMKHILYCFVQCTWGALQSVLGLINFFIHIRDRHYNFRLDNVDVFVTKEPYFLDKLKDEYQKEELSKRLLVHEYGHTIQSLILGPLYLIIMGIPSTIWGFWPSLGIS